MKLANDPRRELFPYAFKCGLRHWRWLFEFCPQDFSQTISLAICMEIEKNRALARVVNRTLYRLAMNEGFHRWGGRKDRHFKHESSLVQAAMEVIER